MSNTSDSQTSSAQSNIEYTALGFYEPGFIHLRVNTYEYLSGLSQLTDQSPPSDWASTFLHEYIHFLQDVCTTHGLLNIIHYIEFLKNANKQVREFDDADFNIPIKISNDFNWNTNTVLKSIYLGGSKKLAGNATYSSYRHTLETVTSGNGAPITAKKYWVDYYDNGAHTSDAVHFGSIHLKEYMAHAVQTQFDPAREHHDIPYRLVEFLVEKEIPILLSNKNLIIALCDAALMHYHPAQLFFDTIERIKSSPNWAPIDVESIYEFTYRDLKPETSESFDVLFEETATHAVNHFRDSLKADIYKDNVGWFAEVISQSKELRLNRRGFFARLVSSEGVLSQEFKETIGALGIPFTTNEKSNGYFIPPANLAHLEIHPYYPKVFEAIIRTYCGRCDCSLQPFCSAESETDITNENCSSRPWERVNLAELCPYAQMWKTWGLSGKTPQPARNSTH